MATVTKMKNGKWKALVRKTGFPHMSKQFELKKEAEKWAYEKERDIELKLHISKDALNLTIGQLIERYIAEKGAKNFGRSKLGALKMLQKHLQDTKLGQFDEQAVIRYCEKRSKTAGPSTITVELTYLGLVLKIAQQIWRLNIPNLIASARPTLSYRGFIGKGNQRDRRPTLDEIKQLCDYFDAKGGKMPMSDIIQFAIATAMRAGEIINLRWSDLDVANKCILIRDRKDPQKKIGNNQWVPLLNICGIDAFAIVQKQERTNERIFPWADGTISSLFPRACKALKIKDLRFHDLRHEACSRMSDEGFNQFEISKCSGHKDIRMLARYVQPALNLLHQKALSTKPMLANAPHRPTAIEIA